MKLINNKNASLFLVVNTVMWGSAYVWSKMVMDYLPPIFALFICELSGLIFTGIIFRKTIRQITWPIFVKSLGFNIFYILSNLFYMFALKYTTSSNVSFIIQLTVVIVPIITFVVFRKRLERTVVIGVICAFIGLILLTVDFKSFSLNTGDMLAFLSAVMFSIYLVRVNRESGKVDDRHISFLYYVVSVVVLPVLSLTFEKLPTDLSFVTNSTFLLIVLADVTVGIVTVLIQNATARFVQPEKTTIIYCLEPVFTVFLAFFLLGEVMDLKAMAGSIFILFSVIYSVRLGGNNASLKRTGTAN